MSKISELKENPDNIVNLAEIAQLFCSGRKTKYVTSFIGLMKNSIYSEKQLRAVRTLYAQKYDLPIEDLTQLNPIQLFFLDVVLEKSLGGESLSTYLKFCDYNERGLIKENDITKYKTFAEIIDSVKIVDEKIAEKEFEKQIKVIHEDDEWFILRPLTFQSSRKYGSGTKWCTTTENNSDYFITYASKGVLIYCLNRKTKYRVAAHRFLQPGSGQDRTVTFWDEMDKKIDSMECGLPDEILKLIKCEIETYPISNFDFLDKKVQAVQKNPTKDENGKVVYRSPGVFVRDEISDIARAQGISANNDDDDDLEEEGEDGGEEEFSIPPARINLERAPRSAAESMSHALRAELGAPAMSDSLKARLNKAIGKNILEPIIEDENTQSEPRDDRTLSESLATLDHKIRSHSNGGREEGVVNESLTAWSKSVNKILKKFER